MVALVRREHHASWHHAGSGSDAADRAGWCLHVQRGNGLPGRTRAISRTEVAGDVPAHGARGRAAGPGIRRPQLRWFLPERGALDHARTLDEETGLDRDRRGRTHAVRGHVAARRSLGRLPSRRGGNRISFAPWDDADRAGTRCESARIAARTVTRRTDRRRHGEQGGDSAGRAGPRCAAHDRVPFRPAAYGPISYLLWRRDAPLGRGLSRALGGPARPSF